MVERTNGSPWYFIGGIALIVVGLAVPLLVDAATGQVQWLVRGAGVLVAKKPKNNTEKKKNYN